MQRQITDIAALNKKGLDAALDAALVVGEAVEKLSRLQIQAAKSLLRETADTGRALASSTSLADLTPKASTVAAANVERVVGYSRNAYDIASSGGVQLLELVNAATADLRKAWTDVAEGLSESMAVGKEGATNAGLKAMMSVSETMMDGVIKSTKDSIELAESALKATAGSTSGAAKAATASKG